MATTMLERLEPSAHADAIYHADLFHINGWNWMIGGIGKSRAAALASNGDSAADIARDTVAIIREGHGLLGRYDPGALPVEPAKRDERYRSHKLDAIAYCLSASETAQAYVDRPMTIAQVDNKMLGVMLSSQIYPADMAPFYFEPGELSRLISRNRRLVRFLELTEGIVGTSFLVVPWMPSVEDKAALYAGFGRAA
jgi:hypothetical protein